MGNILVVIAVIAFFVFLSSSGTEKRQDNWGFGAYRAEVEDGNSFSCLSFYNEHQARALYKKLEVITIGYVNHPLRLGITEVSKFCVALIGEKASFGDSRDKVIMDLMSYFSSVQDFFHMCGYGFCTERFEREWLLKECERMFGSYQAEVLADIRGRIKVADASDDGVEIYRQRIIASQMCGSTTCNLYPLGFFGLEQKNNGKCSREFREWRASIFQRLTEDALRTYLKCLKDVLTCTCLPLIRNGAEAPKNRPEVKNCLKAEKPNPVPKHTTSNPYISASEFELEGSSEPATHQEPPSAPLPTLNPSLFSPEAPPSDKPALLADTALALIGRPTLHKNEYLTPAMTSTRHEAERPFVKVLSSICHNEAERKAISRNFMLWKEFALFVSLSQVLKSDKALLASTQMKLKERLNEGLSAEAVKKRGERMRVMSGAFTDEYKRTGSLEQSFLHSFREMLPEGLLKLPDGENAGSSLYGIYRFICGGLKSKIHEWEHKGS